MGCAKLAACQAGYLNVPLGSTVNLPVHLKHGMNPGSYVPKPLESRMVTAVFFQACELAPDWKMQSLASISCISHTGAGHREEPALGSDSWEGAASPGRADLETRQDCSHITDCTSPVVSGHPFYRGHM